MRKRLYLIAAVMVIGVFGVLTWGFDGKAATMPAKSADLSLESVGPLTFAPDGTLFLADPYGGVVHGVRVKELSKGARGERLRSLDLGNLDQHVASFLGVPTARMLIHDIAVSPASGELYLTVSRGAPDDGTQTKVAYNLGRTPHVIRLTAGGVLSEVSFEETQFTTARLSDVRSEGTNRWGQEQKAWSILELAFHDANLYVSGTSNEEWSAKIRRIPYPFDDRIDSTAIRIFHTAHGRWETGAPARVFAPYTDADGESHLFAGFSCTPLVTFSVAEMRAKKRVVGKTIAELGAGNHVLDMLAVERGGRTSFLLANRLHPFMRLDLEDFEGAASLTRPTRQAGIDRQPLGTDRRVVRVAALDSDRVVLLRENKKGGLDLETVEIDELLKVG